MPPFSSPEGIIVLSLFDGMGCGYEALKRAGIRVKKYYAAEVDRYAKQIAKKNHPDIIHLGDVNDWIEWGIEKPDLIMGGSPCQGFSFAGKQLAFDDPRSKLFFVMDDIINFYDPEYKLLENVRMKKEYLDVITKYMGGAPMFINSAFVSAQNRERYYWFDWEAPQPKDKQIFLADILETDQHNSTIFCGAMRGRYLIHGKRQDHKIKTAGLTSQRMEIRCDGKTNTLTTVQKDNHVIMGDDTLRYLLGELKKANPRVKGISVNSNGVRPHKGDTRKSGISELGRLLFHDAEKTYAITTSHAPKVINDAGYRQLTPVECERLQTLRDGYTEGVSDTQRRKMIGNGWTVDVIAHLFNFLPWGLA